MRIIILYSFLGGLFSYLFTIMGAGIVFFFRKVNSFIMNSFLALSSGVMLAAAFFSLLNPAIELAGKMHQNMIFIVFGGVMFGGLFLYLCNYFFSKLSNKNQSLSSFKRCFLLFTSITLHNIPEGLAVGVAFGSLLYGNSLISAATLTLGIAIQNFPEGSAISLPLRRDGFSRSKSFLFGFLSGLVEPIFAVLGALLVVSIQKVLPFILAFSAGAMLYVTVLELIPECMQKKKKDFMAFLLLFGFSLMMLLEILLG